MTENERINRIVSMAAKFTQEERLDLAQKIASIRDEVPRDTYVRYQDLILDAEHVIGCRVDGTRRAASVMIRRFVAFRMRQEGFAIMDISRTMKVNHATVFHYVKQMQTCFDLPVYYARDLELYHKFEDQIDEQVREPQDRDA